MNDRTERRTEKRKKDRLALVFHYAQEACEVSTVDVSRSGAMIRSPVSFPSGTLLILECPSLCATEGATRVLARVVRTCRGVADRPTRSGLGLHWVRAYSNSGGDMLREFLVDKLGFEPEDIPEIKRSPGGDAVFDFPSGEQPPAAARPAAPDSLAAYQDKRERLVGMQKGRHRLETSIVYSVHNMHYRGILIALGSEGIAVATRSALPFMHSKVVIRYPLETSSASPRIVLFCETEMVLDPFAREPGFFAARILGIDELDAPGIFRMHMRRLSSRAPVW